MKEEISQLLETIEHISYIKNSIIYFDDKIVEVRCDIPTSNKIDEIDYIRTLLVDMPFEFINFDYNKKLYSDVAVFEYKDSN